MTWSFYCPISRSEARFEVRERKREVDNEGFPALNVIFLPSCVFLLFFSFRKLLLARLPVFFEPFFPSAQIARLEVWMSCLPCLLICCFFQLWVTQRDSPVEKSGWKPGKRTRFFFGSESGGTLSGSGQLSFPLCRWEKLARYATHSRLFLARASQIYAHKMDSYCSWHAIK